MYRFLRNEEQTSKLYGAFFFAAAAIGFPFVFLADVISENETVDKVLTDYEDALKYAYTFSPK